MGIEPTTYALRGSTEPVWERLVKLLQAWIVVLEWLLDGPERVGIETISETTRTMIASTKRLSQGIPFADLIKGLSGLDGLTGVVLLTPPSRSGRGRSGVASLACGKAGSLFGVIWRRC